MSRAATEAAVRAEIEDLHAFFEAWFRGTAPRDALEARFLDRLDPEITFIDPHGRRIARDAFRGAFEGAHGRAPDLRIAVRDVRLLREEAELLLATYEEWQHAGDAQSRTGRLSTVVLSRAQPFRWLHVQETWLPAEVVRADPFGA